MWSEQGDQISDARSQISGNSVAAAMLAYDIPHRAPWGWPVSLYVWTKAIAAGAYLVAAGGMLAGRDYGWRFVAPVLSAIFLAITFALLIGDLTHPTRFYLILTRPQWRSWLVRGGIILTAFSAVVGIHLLWSLLGGSPPAAIAIIGAICAIAAGTYTAFLFAQAKARDLWQSPLLAPQHLVATVVAGAAVLRAPVVLAIATIVFLVLVAAEIVTPHPTAHSRMAVKEMVRGRYRVPFMAGCLLMLAAVALLGTGVAQTLLSALPALLVLAGLLLYEHAHVAAGQSVPLA